MALERGNRRAGEWGVGGRDGGKGKEREGKGEGAEEWVGEKGGGRMLE